MLYLVKALRGESAMQPLFQTDQIFKSLVREINQLINEDVIITDENGVIVASTELARVNEFHEGAYLAMKKREKMIMTKELSEQLKGVRKGIVLPVIIEDKPIGVLGITGDPIKVEPYARIVQKMSELFIKGTIDQMTQEKMARNLELFVFDWIHGNVSRDVLIERGEFFNLDVVKYSQVISLHIPFTTNDLSYKEIISLRTQWDQKGEAIFVRWGQGKLLIIDKEYERNALSKKINVFLENAIERLDNEVYVGVGQPSGYEALSSSFEQAERACLIAKREKRIVFEEELRFEMVQYELNDQTKEKFVERTIASLLDDETILLTLNSWLENDMSIQKTAEDLHIHKNTLYYRLEKIENLTDLNVSRMEHVVLLYLANRFIREDLSNKGGR